MESSLFSQGHSKKKKIGGGGKTRSLKLKNQNDQVIKLARINIFLWERGCLLPLLRH